MGNKISVKKLALLSILILFFLPAVLSSSTGERPIKYFLQVELQPETQMLQAKEKLAGPTSVMIMFPTSSYIFTGMLLKMSCPQ
jgi:hypothetical protein